MQVNKETIMSSGDQGNELDCFATKIMSALFAQAR
jgi:hypothetical protein